MKNNIYIISILFLFQSCYSYKTFDLNNYNNIKPKKVEIELKNSQKYQGKVIQFNNDNITLKHSKSIKKIPLSSIKEIKRKKFSLLKTTGLTYAIAGLTLIISLAYFLNGL